MGTFGFDKSVDEIEEPELFTEDWYTARVCEEPRLEPNKKKKDKKLKSEGAGDNLVIKLAIEHPLPEYNGRKFTLWLPYPDAEDKNLYDARGMIVYDAKLERLAQFSLACGHMPAGNTIEINAGDRVKVYIVQGMSMDGQKIVNNLDNFAGFQPVDWVAEEPLNIPDPTGLGDDEAF